MIFKVAYQKQEWKIAKAASDIMWNHFVMEKEEEVKTYQTIHNDFQLKPKKYVDGLFIFIKKVFIGSVAFQGLIKNWVF